MSNTNFQENTNSRQKTLPVRDRLRADLIKAMKARQTSSVITIRAMLAAIDNAEAVEPPEGMHAVVGGSGDVPRHLLSEEDIRAILLREAEGRRANFAQYENLGKHEYAERLRAELEVFARYLD